MVPSRDMPVSKWVIEFWSIYVKLLVPLSNYGGPLAEKAISKDPVFMGLLLDPLPKRDKNFLEVIAVYPVRVFHCFVLCFLARKQYEQLAFQVCNYAFRMCHVCPHVYMYVPCVRECFKKFRYNGRFMCY